MRRLWILLALVAGCVEPPKQNVALQYQEHLRDIYAWDPVSGAKGHYAYDVMLSVEPEQSVPVLIGKLADTAPTAIQDSVHDPVPVCAVAFHILLRIFAMPPEAFEREGVWVMKSEPTRNPIYMVKFKDDATRARVAGRFRELAIDRGWMTP